MAAQPWFKFYAGDWFSDGKLRKCRAEGIAVWIQALVYMHKEETSNISGDIIELAMALNLPESQVEEGVRQIEKYDVCNVERDGHGCVTLTSRRLSRAEAERQSARERKRRQRKREKGQSRGSHKADTDTHARVRADSDSYSNTTSIKKIIEKEASPDYDAVMESWNAFARDAGIPQIRKMTEDRRAAVRQRGEEIWPVIDEIYAEIRGSPFLLGREGRESWNGATLPPRPERTPEGPSIGEQSRRLYDTGQKANAKQPTSIFD